MSTPIEMRKYLGYMRGKKVDKKLVNKISKKELTMRDLLGKMRKLNEGTKLNEDTQQNLATPMDQQREEDNMNNYFQDDNVTIDYEKLVVKSDKVFFGGSFVARDKGEINFVYMVPPKEKSTGIEIGYLDGFDTSDPENDKIIKKIESYYTNNFYKYWRDSLFED